LAGRYKRRRNGRVVDCGGLENRCPGDWTGGSNPSFSAPGMNTRPSVTAWFLFYTGAKRELALDEQPIKQKYMRLQAHVFKPGAGLPPRDHAKHNPSSFLTDHPPHPRLADEDPSSLRKGKYYYLMPDI
jgi:hypothetical protein